MFLCTCEPLDLLYIHLCIMQSISFSYCKYQSILLSIYLCIYLHIHLHIYVICSSIYKDTCVYVNCLKCSIPPSLLQARKLEGYKRKPTGMILSSHPYVRWAYIVQIQVRTQDFFQGGARFNDISLYAGGYYPPENLRGG